MQEIGPTSPQRRPRWLDRASVAVVLVLAACSAAPAAVAPTETTTESPSVPPSPMPTASPSCPEPTEGTQFLRQDALGYCLLYPDGLVSIETPPDQVCFVPEGPAMLCHTAAAFINVSDAGGRSASELADAKMVREGGFGPERESLAIAAVEAVVLPMVGGQASTRQVWLVHEDRLYTLSFVLPDPGDAPAVEQSQRLYETVVGSFTLIPVDPSATSSKVGRAGRGSAVVAYLKDGDILVWEEATGESRTIYESGDASRLELSDDGQLVAFVRRPSSEGPLDHELWVVEIGGGSPRQLVSTGELRARLRAAETENVELPCMQWIPNSHRLLYSGLASPPAVGAGCLQAPTRGLYLLDADSLTSVELISPPESVEFLPSPDGSRVAILRSTGLAFVSVADSLAGRAVDLRPVGGLPVSYCGSDCVSGRAWTQDSSAVLVRGSIGFDRDLGPGFTLWRVPVDGSAAEQLIELRGEREQFSPDGSSLAYLRWTAPFGQARRFVVPLPEELGPLAIRSDPLGLFWSLDGTGYVLGGDQMSPLCPGATQATDVCGPPVHFAGAVEPFSLEWVDRERFLYLTHVPRRLMLGSMDGSATVVVEDPQAPGLDGAVALVYAGVAATCADDSEFVSDLTVPDGTHLAPGSFTIKTWRLRNTGTCTWDGSYRFTFLSGDRMSGPRSAPLDQSVPPGMEVELSVGLVAPEAPGTYRGSWTLFAPDGMPFGTRAFVQIQVP